MLSIIVNISYFVFYKVRLSCFQVRAKNTSKDLFFSSVSGNSVLNLYKGVIPFFAFV